MDIKKLRYFKAVAEELHFGHAAEKLFVDPSSVSRAIQGLEQTLDVKLFDRLSDGIRLTNEGLILQHESNKILFSIEQVKHIIKHPYSTGRLNVAISPH